MSEPTSRNRNLRPEAEVPVRAGIPRGQLWYCAEEDYIA